MRLGELGARGRALWLDHTAYTAALLAGGQVPWLDTAACTAWAGKAQSLLRSDVVALPLADVADALLASRPELLQAMADKRRRVVAPLRVLLADEGLRVRLVDLMLAWRAKFTATPLVLACPSPRLALLWAHARCAPEDTPDIDDDAVDGAAAYLADLLRVYSQCGIDAVLLKEQAETQPADADALALYQPLFNVAAHYRWEIGLQLPTAGAGLPLSDGLHFIVAPQAALGALADRALPIDGWCTTAWPPAAGSQLTHTTVPADAQPEAVLAQLAAWREGG